MKRFLMSAAVAAAALLGSSLPSAAIVVPVDCNAGGEPCNIGTFTLLNPEITFFDTIGGAEGFLFNIGAGLTSIHTVSINSEANETTLVSASITGPGVSQPGVCGAFLTSSVCAFDFTQPLVSGVAYLLTLVTAGPAGNVQGDITVTLASTPNPVPLPGALLLMGSVLMGGAGLAKWRKGHRRLPA